MPISHHEVIDHLDPDDGYRVAWRGADDGGYWIPESHQAAIGGFLFVCADLEAIVISQLRTATGMPDPIAQAVVGVPRISDAIASLGRVCALSGLEDDRVDLLNSWRSQTTYIFAVRNVVAHQTPAWRADWLRYQLSRTKRDNSDPAKLAYVCQLSELQALTRFARHQWLSLSHITDVARGDLSTWDAACEFFNDHALPPDPRR